MKLVSETLLNALSERAKTIPRKRTNHNFHPSPQDTVQRLLNAIEPGTYIRPHRHSDPASFEFFFIVRGAAVLLTFDDAGRVLWRETISENGPVFGVEIPENTWHAMASLKPGTVFFEIKQGPYLKPQQPHTASWAPGEGEPGEDRIVEWYKQARTGDVFSLPAKHGAGK